MRPPPFSRVRDQQRSVITHAELLVFDGNPVLWFLFFFLVVLLEELAELDHHVHVLAPPLRIVRAGLTPWANGELPRLLERFRLGCWSELAFHCSSAPFVLHW